MDRLSVAVPNVLRGISKKRQEAALSLKMNPQNRPVSSSSWLPSPCAADESASNSSSAAAAAAAAMRYGGGRTPTRGSPPAACAAGGSKSSPVEKVAHDAVLQVLMRQAFVQLD